MDKTPKTKVCTKCGKRKALEKFYKSRSNPSARCKECTKQIVNSYRLANLETISQRKKESYRKNPTAYIERSRAAYWNDPDKARQAAKEWRRKNPEKAAQLAKRSKQSVAGKNRTAKYRAKHRQRLLEREAKRQRLYAEKLDDKYVASQICLRSNLKLKDVPPELIEAKRIQLQIKRYLRENMK
jgi:hypothetical protein